MPEEGTHEEEKAVEGRTVDHSMVVMSEVFLPQHAGPGGTFAHGGEIMKTMDSAAGVAAVRHAHSPVVTLRVEAINFYHPIRVGNFVQFKARLTYASKSTMEVQVRVVAEDIIREKSWECCTAYFIFVAMGVDGKPMEVPPLILRTDEERNLFEAGESRHNVCRIDEQSKILCALD